MPPYKRGMSYEIMYFLNWNIFLKAGTDFEITGKKVSKKHFFISEIWAFKVFKK